MQFKRRYFCSKCGRSFDVEADIESTNMYPKPVVCAATEDCPGREFQLQELDPRDQDHRDYQEIKVQEQLHQLHVGAMPRSVHVLLTEDLVDLCKAGDDVTINGIVSRRWRQFNVDDKCDLDMIIVGNYLKVNNEHNLGLGMTEELKQEFEQFWKSNALSPMKGRDFILKGICPDVFGMFVVKLAIALVVAGGVQRRTRDNTKVRGESHLLLVGDPGTGKSQILKFAAKLASRSVVTTGIGTTGAGLTVTAVKDKGGEWVLEAGALVLADGGICCIDEFNTMAEHDKTTIHEAMEQQTLSIAKAGLVCKLQTRCSVLGATNTKGRYDPNETLSANVSVAGPLLSRFDLVIVMVDGQDRAWDSRLADFILENRQKTAILIAQQQQEYNLRKEQEGFRTGDRKAVWQRQRAEDDAATAAALVQMDYWPVDKLQAYFNYIRATFAPSLSESAREVLTAYYSKQRVTDTAEKARTTIRMLESLIRLAEAHAKIMFRTEVLLIDAIVAIYTMEASVGGSASILSCPPTVQSQFDADPDAFFASIQVSILSALQLRHLDQAGTAAQFPRDTPPDFDLGERDTSSRVPGAFGGARGPVGYDTDFGSYPASAGTDPRVATGVPRYPTPSGNRLSDHSQHSQRQRQMLKTVVPPTPSPLNDGDVPATPSPTPSLGPSRMQPSQVFRPPASLQRPSQAQAARPSVSSPAPPPPVAEKIVQSPWRRSNPSAQSANEEAPAALTQSIAADDLVGDVDWGLDDFG